MRSDPCILEPRTQIVVKVGDGRVSNRAQDVLVTYSLGSCVGVAVYEPLAGVAGLLHFQLPSSSLDAGRALERPFMFADTGMRQLLLEMERHGAQCRKMRVKIAGAAEMLDAGGVFNIGARNHAAIRKFLWQHRLFIEAEDVGGGAPRTIYFRVADGSVVLKSPQRTRNL